VRVNASTNREDRDGVCESIVFNVMASGECLFAVTNIVEFNVSLSTDDDCLRIGRYVVKHAQRFKI